MSTETPPANAAAPASQLPVTTAPHQHCGSHGTADAAAGACSHPDPATASTCDTAKGVPAEVPLSEASKETRLIEALKTVIDPELMVNIVDLGLVYAIDHTANKASIEMTLTSPACPAGPQIIQQARMALERLHDVDEVEIRLVMSPPWTPDRMTDEARDMLGIF